MAKYLILINNPTLVPQMQQNYVIVESEEGSGRAFTRAVEFHCNHFGTAIGITAKLISLVQPANEQNMLVSWDSREK